MDLNSYVRNVPDFPSKGIMFKDITPLLKNPEAFNETIKRMQDIIKDWNFTTIVAPESRGYFFASPLAILMNKGLVPVRKPGKLPYKTINATYALEYGTAELQMHVDAIQKGERVVIIDDVLATGGTIEAITKLVKQSGGEVEGILCFAELSFLNPRQKLSDLKIASLIEY